MKRKEIISTFLLLCIALTGNAQEFFALQQQDTVVKTPHVEVATQLAVGASNMLDTYLSPEKYRGGEVRFVSQVMRDSRKRSMTYTLTHEGDVGYTENRAKNGAMLSGHYDFSYAAMYRWRLLDNRLTLRAGTMADLNLGFAYNTHNAANNPAQGYVSADIGAQMMASYVFKVFKKKFRVNYEMRMPVVGLMFSPNYGQSYYELFSENGYDNNVVVTSLATFQMRQQLSLDIPVSKRMALRVGYLCDIRQAKPNNLLQHHWYNAGTIGMIIRK